MNINVLLESKEEKTILSEDFLKDSKEELSDFLSGNDELEDLQITYQLYDENKIQRGIEKNIIPVMCMLNDIRDGESSVNSLFLGSGKTKYEIFKEVYKEFLNLKINGFNNHDVSYDTFYGSKRLNFRINIPKEVLFKYYSDKTNWFLGAGPVEVDLNKLNLEEKTKFVIPMYYYELGMHDRGFLRYDTLEMNYLRRNWYNTLEAKIA